MLRKYALLVVLLLAPPFASAEKICQETDEYGNVSYTDCVNTENPDATPVDVPPINTADPNEFISNIPVHKSNTSTAAEKRKSLVARRKELEAAKQALEQARQVGEGDRIGTVNGSRLTDQYLNRVKAAEERVRKAEQALK